MRLACLALLAALLACPAGCDGPAAPPTRPMVVVSVLPQAYLVERIAGDLVDIQVMIPPGAGEMYEPTVSQIAAAARASLYVKVGHPNFPFEAQWLDRMVGEETPVVDASAEFQRRDSDPHVWVSPASARRMAENIGAALVKLLPEHRDALLERQSRLIDDIDELDEEIRTMLAPCRGRTFFVFHPAWGYFADEYGLVQRSIEHDHKQPSTGHLVEFEIAARESNARAIFVQPQFPREAADRIGDDIGAEVIVVDPLQRDWLAGTRHMAESLARTLAP